MKNWVLVDRQQVLLLPPSVDELLPEELWARFVVEVVDTSDPSAVMVKCERAGRGRIARLEAARVAIAERHGREKLEEYSNQGDEVSRPPKAARNTDCPR